MSKYASSGVSILVDGVDLSPVLTETVTQSVEGITQQTNPFGSTSEVHTPVGMTKGMLSLGGAFFDEAVDTLHAGIADSGLGVSRIASILVEGQTAGAHFTGYAGAISQKYEVVDTNGDFAKANLTVLVSGAVDVNAVILQALTAKTADWDTTAAPYDSADDGNAEQHPITTVSLANPSVVTCPDNHGLTTGDVVAIFGVAGGIDPDINDSGAGAWQYVGHTVTVTGLTTFTIPVNVTTGGTGGYFVVVSQATGGAGYLQITAGSGFTNFVGTIKHSVDGAVWADLVTFADTTTDYSTAQRVATATATTQVRRYLSFFGNVTGAGSLTVFSGFGRGTP